MDNELIDDVFEEESAYNPKNYYQNTDTGLNVGESIFLDERSPSPPTFHPGIKPPRDGSRSYQNGNKARARTASDDDDGWKSYRIEDDSAFDENFLHKVRAIFFQYLNHIDYQRINVIHFFLAMLNVPFFLIRIIPLRLFYSVTQV